MAEARRAIDPVSVEGSPERAADRGRDLLFGDAFASDLPSLGDPNVVEHLVRDFLGKVAATRGAWNRGELDDQAAAQRTLEEAARMARIFTGGDPDYAALPFHRNAEVKAFVKDAEGYDCPDDEAVPIYFNRLAVRILKAMAAFADGTMPDHQAQFEIEAMVEDATLTLRGLPPIPNE